MAAYVLAALALLCAWGAHAATTPEVPPAPAPEPGPLPGPTTNPVLFPGPPKRPEWAAMAPEAAMAPGVAPVTRRPGFDYIAEKRWNLVNGGALPFNGSAPTMTMVRAAGALRKQRILDSASAPWQATQLHAALPVTPGPSVTTEEVAQHANVLPPPAAGLTGWRRSATGKFSIASGVEDDSSAGSTPLVVIEQEDATTNAYVYQRALATAYTLYTLRVTTSVNSGVGKAGVAFFAANKTILSAPAIDLPAGNSSVHTMRVSAPQGSMAASVFVGKFDGMGGQLQLIEASFGATIYSAINANTRGYIRHLSTFGPGLCLNYWNDGNSAFNNYGSGFLAALQSMNLGSLRYPGGEKADSYAWAPPPWTSSTKPNPVLTRATNSDWPGGSNWMKSLSNGWGVFNFPTLDFDQFMSITKATSTTPYLVLNYDSANLIYGSGDWSYSQLLALAQSWLQYIIRMGYQVTMFEFANESFNNAYNGKATSQQYAQAFADWAPQLKKTLPSMKLGVNGQPPYNSIGAADKSANTGGWWWPAIFAQGQNYIDYLILHSYPIWDQTYSYYSNANENFQADPNDGQFTIQAWASSANAGRIRLAFTEFAAIDWGGQWGTTANLGLGLATFDMMAQLLSHPLVDVAHLWTTRWRTSYPGSYSGASNFEALTGSNSLSAIGMAAAIAGKYFKSGDLVQSDSLQSMRSWVIMTKSYSGITIILLNRSYNTVIQTTNIVSNPSPWYWGSYGNGQQWIFGAHAGYSGSPDMDTNPTFTMVANNIQINNWQVVVKLPPVSLSVIVF